MKIEILERKCMFTKILRLDGVAFQRKNDGMWKAETSNEDRGLWKRRRQQVEGLQSTKA